LVQVCEREYLSIEDDDAVKYYLELGYVIVSWSLFSVRFFTFFYSFSVESTNQNTGAAPTAEIPANIHQGKTTLPLSRLTVNTAPNASAPIARQSADVLVAKPFSVPSTLLLLAELLKRIIEQGNEKVVQVALLSKRARLATVELKDDG